jgi:DNA adenine methylase
MNMERVSPAAPVAPWLGGKKALSAMIIERIEAVGHATYVEPFVGMGGVFLRRKWRPKLEVANDFNGEITNLFRILQQHYPQLMDVMRFQIALRREFERLRKTDPSTLTDLQRAARFLYLQRQAFGGKLGGVFGVASDRAPRFSLSWLEPILEAAHERLEMWRLKTLTGRMCSLAMMARTAYSTWTRPIGVVRMIMARVCSIAVSFRKWVTPWRT